MGSGKTYFMRTPCILTSSLRSRCILRVYFGRFSKSRLCIEHTLSGRFPFFHYSLVEPDGLLNCVLSTLFRLEHTKTFVSDVLHSCLWKLFMRLSSINYGLLNN